MTPQGWRLFVAVSLVPLGFKAAIYGFLGSWIPLGVFLGLVGLVGWGFRGGASRQIRCLRLWAGALILWATIRLILMGLFRITPVSEAHLEGQFGLGFVILSLTWGCLGIYLFRKAPVYALQTGRGAFERRGDYPVDREDSSSSASSSE